MEHFFNDKLIVSRLKQGPLAEYFDGSAQLLRDQMFQPDWARHQIRLMAEFSCWLQDRAARN